VPKTFEVKVLPISKSKAYISGQTGLKYALLYVQASYVQT